MADAWWQLLYDNHATLVLNGHEHTYARMRPMDPAGNYDRRRALRRSSSVLVARRRTASRCSAYAQGYGVMNLTLSPDSFTYKPVLAGAGFGASALDYSDSGSGKCQG